MSDRKFRTIKSYYPHTVTLQSIPENNKSDYPMTSAPPPSPVIRPMGRTKSCGNIPLLIPCIQSNIHCTNITI